ncbi:TRAP transporter substrate-binding protein [Reyranella sp.]|uniref:TRAP transporter substrate-binding protein n=1 Tax=Reyranella sp. TaxID=1929291 RepID=UPI003D0E26FA
MTVRRRKFLPAAAATVAASTLAAPAIAQTDPVIKWRLTASYPKSLDTLFGAVNTVAKTVSDLTDGKFELQTFAAGEIVPGLQVLDAVANGTVECGLTYMGYYIGKNSAAIFDASLPFGLTPRQHAAWLNFGGGRALVDEVYDGFGVVAITSGNTGGQMFGWFRKELKTPKDLEGLKMRTAGFGGKVMAKLGVVAQQIVGGEIYPSLERGTIDACEWVGPYDDEKLGFNKVAKYYYTPGVMELEATNQLMIGKKAWATLPPRYQAAMRAAGAVANQEMLASYDAKNAEAIARLVAAGTQLSVLPEEIIKALRVALEQVLDEEAAANEQFKKILTNWRAFRANQHRWFSIADTRAENAVYRSTPS